MSKHLVIWQQILTILGGSTIGVGAVAWLIKSLTAHLLSKDVEKFKHDLERMAYEHSVQFAELHNRRTIAIIDLYNALVDAVSSIWSIVKPFQRVDVDFNELIYQAENKCNAFQEKRIRTRLYFNESLAKKLGEENDELWNAFIDAKACSGMKDSEDQNCHSSTREALKQSRSVVEQIQGRIYGDLSNEFRIMLGVLNDQHVASTSDGAEMEHE